MDDAFTAAAAANVSEIDEMLADARAYLAALETARAAFVAVRGPSDWCGADADAEAAARAVPSPSFGPLLADPV